MCGCSWKLGNETSLKDVKIQLNASDIADYRTKDILLCIYSASPSKFKDAFRNVTLNGSSLADDIENESDMTMLATVHDAGNDMKLYGVDFLKVAQGIKHTDAELKNATCQIGIRIK